MNNIKFNCANHVYEFYTNCSPRVFGKAYSIRICSNCGVGETVPRPSAAIEHYEASARDPSDEAVTYSIKFAKQSISLIDNIYYDFFGSRPSSIIDVGCGYGFLAGQAKIGGYHSVGIEPSKIMSAYAHTNNGIEVFSGSLFDYKDFSKFNVVFLESVAEHFENIFYLLEFLKNSCSPTTMICFGQAVYDGLVPRLLKKFWYGWSPEEHFWHFTQKSFEDLLKSNGFSLIRIVKRPLTHNFYFGRNLKRFFFLNFVATLSLVARFLGKEDHATFFVTVSPTGNSNV